MRKILVTAISGNIGYGILKILRERNEGVLYGCDVNAIAAGMDLVEVFWKCRYAVDDGYIDEMLEQCRKYGITHVIPANEREIERISKERERFLSNGIRLLILRAELLDIFLDKYHTAEYLKRNGFLVPATYIDPGKVSFGNGKYYICKPRRSNGSRDLKMVMSREQLSRIDLTNQVLQEYIESEEEYTIGVFRSGEVTNTIIFLRKLKNGFSTQVQLTFDEAMDCMARRLAEETGLQGYLNIQLRKKDGEFFVFEINPRISGTVRFRDMLDFSDVLWWLDLVDGIPAVPFHCAYTEALGVRELNEKYLVRRK